MGISYNLCREKRREPVNRAAINAFSYHFILLSEWISLKQCTLFCIGWEYWPDNESFARILGLQEYLVCTNTWFARILGLHNSWFAQTVGLHEQLVCMNSWFARRVGLNEYLVWTNTWFARIVGFHQQLNYIHLKCHVDTAYKWDCRDCF